MKVTHQKHHFMTMMKLKEVIHIQAKELNVVYI